MNTSLSLLAFTAVTIGFIHTVLGPDHYVPFVAMARAGGWSGRKTLWITFLCGLGHIGSSIILGFIGIALGLAVGKLEALESARGNLAAWALIAFGLVYTVWGLRRALRNHHDHKHLLPHHHHNAASESGGSHIDSQSEGRPDLTPWIMFTVFVLGPCEPLIPLVMYPAAQHSFSGVVVVAAVFGVTTVATMMAIVAALRAGVQLLPLEPLERFTHALAGGAILACGLSIHFLGL